MTYSLAPSQKFQARALRWVAMHVYIDGSVGYIVVVVGNLSHDIFLRLFDGSQRYFRVLDEDEWEDF